MNSSISISTNSDFQRRHIGPKEGEIQSMLRVLGLSSLEALADRVIPQTIRTQKPFPSLGEGLSEDQALGLLKAWMSENKVAQSYIGLGFHDCRVPSVIQRCIFENPLWYTAYTPYQPEISQGRLESLLNFQTMIVDLTQMEIANASLLDEGTAAAEALAMAHAAAKNKSDRFWVSDHLHPHVIEVLKTRSEPLGLKMRVGGLSPDQLQEPIFAVFTQYPGTDGSLASGRKLTEWVHA
ncbi:MAG: hypothetical protein WCH11_01825 [Bdellovibrio sp.]